MANRIVLALIALLALAQIPGPAAAAPACAAVTEMPATSAGGAYVVREPARVSVWTESNDLPGLQRQACEDDNGRSAPADTLVYAASLPDPRDLCVGSVCVL